MMNEYERGQAIGVPTMKVVNITFDLDGREVNLTLDEAKELKRALDELLTERSLPGIWPYRDTLRSDYPRCPPMTYTDSATNVAEMGDGRGKF